MALTFSPKPGQILMCDFRRGFKEPEMVKTRPVVVLTPWMEGRKELATIVGLSCIRPQKIRQFHCKLPAASLPMIRDFDTNETWVKGDMVYAVGYHRLNLIQLGRRGQDGKRLYFTDRLSRARMREIYTCVLHGMYLGSLAEYLPE